MDARDRETPLTLLEEWQEERVSALRRWNEVRDKELVALRAEAARLRLLVDAKQEAMQALEAACRKEMADAGA